MPGIAKDIPLYERMLALGYREAATEMAMYLDLAAFAYPAAMEERAAKMAAQGYTVDWYKEGVHRGVDEMVASLGNPMWDAEIPRRGARRHAPSRRSLRRHGRGLHRPGVPEPTGRGYFAGIAVEERYRGHGLGKLLFYRLCRAEKECGAQYMSLFTGIDNPAQNIYKEAGFTPRRYFAVMIKELKSPSKKRYWPSVRNIGDMELTCGALLAANAVHGGRSMTLALTAGEKGAPAGADVAEYRKSKIAEAEAFAAELGGEAIVLGYPDGPPDNDEARFAVCDVIRRVKPDILITHHAHSMHKDHAACRRIVTDAWFYAAIEGLLSAIFPRHFARHLYYAENWGRMPRGFPALRLSRRVRRLRTLGKGHRAPLVRRTQHELSLQGILFPSQASARHRGAEGVLRVLYDPRRADAHRQKTGG